MTAVRKCLCAHGWRANTASTVCTGVIASLGSDGVNEVAEVELTDSETAALKEAAIAVAEKVADLEEIDY